MMVKAELNRYNQAPRKVRLLADLIRGKSVGAAVSELAFLAKKASLPFTKLLKSAIANAKNNFKLSEDDLFVKEITVDGGPVMKRGMPRAFGRSYPIRRKTSHVTLVLDVKEHVS
ncbi:MAG: 50S ribosomal protein L22 [Candidatus Vogelbacteria bacterium]|nr:50S ribosomal protein L22 [Candidatus Vogelbacteria bacterium]